MRDICSGLNGGLYARRRDSVAALNTAAWAAWAAHGRLNGPELQTPRAGAPHAAGDRIVTLAPAAGGTHRISPATGAFPSVEARTELWCARPVLLGCAAVVG